MLKHYVFYRVVVPFRLLPDGMEEGVEDEIVRDRGEIDKVYSSDREV
jgi:hypothetical protein